MCILVWEASVSFKVQSKMNTKLSFQNWNRQIAHPFSNSSAPKRRFFGPESNLKFDSIRKRISRQGFPCFTLVLRGSSPSILIITTTVKFNWIKRLGWGHELQFPERSGANPNFCLFLIGWVGTGPTNQHSSCCQKCALFAGNCVRAGESLKVRCCWPGTGVFRGGQLWGSGCAHYLVPSLRACGCW